MIAAFAIVGIIGFVGGAVMTRIAMTKILERELKKLDQRLDDYISRKEKKE